LFFVCFVGDALFYPEGHGYFFNKSSTLNTTNGKT
jgi:hypothetical protein